MAADNVFFAGLIGASVAIASPASAKFIGTMYYDPSVMLEMCQSEIERGQAGFCTGYVFATLQQMETAGEVCQPEGIDIGYEDMVSVVVRRLQYVLRQIPSISLYTRRQVEMALRFTWPCKR